MKLFNQFKGASIILLLLVLLVVSCEKDSIHELHDYDIQSLVNLQQNILKELSLIDDFDEILNSNKEDIALFEMKFSFLYRNYGEEFLTRYSEKHTRGFFTNYEYASKDKVVLRGTPCFDAYESADRFNLNTYALCIVSGGNAACLADYVASDLENRAAFERCLEDTYE